MEIMKANEKDMEQIAPLIAAFRVEHRRLKGIKSTINIEFAKEEYKEYIEAGFPIYKACNDDGEVLGYVVCRVDEDVVWVESIYVKEDYRRLGLAKALFLKAESLAESLGGDTLYNWVLPNNDKIINFLGQQGYQVLNMIEIRKPYQQEELKEKIQVGQHKYWY